MRDLPFALGRCWRGIKTPACIITIENIGPKKTPTNDSAKAFPSRGGCEPNDELEALIYPVNKAKSDH